MAEGASHFLVGLLRVGGEEALRSEGKSLLLSTVRRVLALCCMDGPTSSYLLQSGLLSSCESLGGVGIDILALGPEVG